MSTSTRYSGLAMSFHWLSLGLLIIIYGAAELKGFYPKGDETRNLLAAIHMSCGITVLALSIARLVARALQKAPAINPPPKNWENIAAKLMHLALYAILIGLPLLAWLSINARGFAVSAWGIDLPLLIGPKPEIAGQLKSMHVLLANIGYGLIGLHALAALKHHYISRDNTLLRMLPAGR